MLVPFQKKSPEIPVSSDLKEAIDAAKKFMDSGLDLRDVIIDAWVNRTFKNDWYWDGVDKARFQGVTDTEQFSNWLDYVCYEADVPAPVKSGLRGMCLNVIPLIEQGFIQQTLGDFTEISESKMGRVVSAVNTVLKQGYTEETSTAVEGIIAMGRKKDVTVAEFESWLAENEYSKPHTKKKKTVDVPIVKLQTGAEGIVYVIRVPYGPQNTLVHDVLQNWQLEEVEEISEEDLDVNNIARNISNRTWTPSEEDWQ